MAKYIIYTDGASRGNPGLAAAGAVIVDEAGKVLGEVSKFLGTQTNNWAEYEAVALGLAKLKALEGLGKLKEAEVEVRMDSQLAARQLSGVYQVKEETLFPQFFKVWNIKVSSFPKILFTHIEREKNKAADFLANKAIDEHLLSRNPNSSLF